MKIPLIRIGNSRGIRIPKAVIEECQLTNEVQLEIREQSIVISPINASRQGWEADFASMHDSGLDGLIDETVPTHWETSEWEWK